MSPIPMPLAQSKFNLNSAGVAGFFGGKEAISAMATVHLYKGRRWFGWFNSPGSYTIAKRFGRMANSRFWDGLFPGSNDSPAVTFGLDGKKGPRYIAALSGTTMRTGHLAYLTMERCRHMEGELLDGRVTRSVDVAYLAMKPVDCDPSVKCLPINDALMGLIPISASFVTCLMCALVYDWLSFSMILIGIISSGLASVYIGKGRLTIEPGGKPAEGVPPGHGVLLGEEEVVVIKGREQDVNVITKGRFVLETSSEKGGKGKGTGTKKGKERATEVQQLGEGNGTHPQQGHEEQAIELLQLGGGSGVDLKLSDEEGVVDLLQLGEGSGIDLKQGDEEGVVGPQQTGEGSGIDPQRGSEDIELLQLGEGSGADPKQGDGEGVVEPQQHGNGNTVTKPKHKKKSVENSYHAIGVCSLLLIVQFLLQLLLIPQGSLFGQTMFLVSLGISWGYNSYLSSLEKEKIQTQLLFQKLRDPEMIRFSAGTRTTMAVFVCLLVFHGIEHSSSEEDVSLRIKILHSCLSNDTRVWERWADKVVRQLLHIDTSLSFLKEDKEDEALAPKDRDLLGTLLGDARVAFREYLRVRHRLPRDSSAEARSVCNTTSVTDRHRR